MLCGRASSRIPVSRGPPSRDELDRRLRLDLCDERIEIRNPAEFPAADEYHGHEGVRQWAADVWEVFSEMHHELEEIIEADDGERSSAFSARTDSCVTPSFRWTSVWAAVWTIRDGKAVRSQGYMTKAEALEAAGVSG